MKKIIICLALIAFVLNTHAQLNLTWQSENTLSNFKTAYSESNWLVKPSALFEINDSGTLETTLQSRIIEDGSLEMILTIKNTGSSSIVAEPVFPLLRNICPEGTATSSLFCFFPKQGELANNMALINHEEAYSGYFPFQFINVYARDKGGIYIMTKDTQNTPKNYFLKKINGTVDMGVKYRPKELAPQEVWVLPPAILKAHEGDWHDAFYDYRDWVRTWHKPVLERKEWFQDIFNYRQLFLHYIFGEEGAYDASTGKLDLVTKIRESEEAFGGVDYVKLFDWGRDPISGRCGDYTPWNYYGEQLKTELISQIQILKSMGINTGLYYEGYLISNESNIAKLKGEEWQMLEKSGAPSANMGENKYFYACPHNEEWIEYLSNTVTNITSMLGTAGAYIDELGFGWQYPCYNPNHNHDILHTGISGELQVPAETKMMQIIRSNLPDDIVTLTEECPTDVSTQYQDGSYSYGVAFARYKNGNPAGNNNPAAISLARFAFPDYKLFEILRVDEPLGNDIEGVNLVFFNGNGLWIEGPLNNTTWFPLEVRDVIKKCYTVLKRNAENFRSNNPMPLVPTLDFRVFANLFPTEKKNLWTIFNAYEWEVDKPVLEIPHVEGAVYYDEWNDKVIIPEIVNGKAIIKLQIEAKGVRCVSQKL